MKEDFLHYLWKHKKFDLLNLKSADGSVIHIVKVGTHNHNAGPDFFNAQIEINELLWVGNVEIHMSSSDWCLHGHQDDPNYENVILHVVWEHDLDIHLRDNSKIPVLVLKDYVRPTLLKSYNQLFKKAEKWINCESDFKSVQPFILNHWLERLFIERLEAKSNRILQLLKVTNNNWEAVMFQLLARGFGLKVNGDAFASMAKSFDFKVLRKSQSKLPILEALLFGQAGLLNTPCDHKYFKTLHSDYQFLRKKFGLTNESVVSIQFFRLRPMNFPTIRMAQLANLYHENRYVFAELMTLNIIEDYYKFFTMSASSFWNTHYTFDKASKSVKKVLSKPFIDLIILNVIIPMKFCYRRYFGNMDYEDLIVLADSIKPEKNNVISAFNSLRKVATSAYQSQALLELKSEYCDRNRCLNCAVGHSLLSR